MLSPAPQAGTRCQSCFAQTLLVSDRDLWLVTKLRQQGAVKHYHTARVFNDDLAYMLGRIFRFVFAGVVMRAQAICIQD